MGLGLVSALAVKADEEDQIKERFNLSIECKECGEEGMIIFTKGIRCGERGDCKAELAIICPTCANNVEVCVD